ncbi:MAG: acetylornithine deacetylase [Candidatus Pacebacteria bacterium]|nr:acetylornithine deacetylase [Candidatus Paceibacterota bacterium]
MNTIELVEKLIGFDTVSCRPTKEIADFISEFLERSGFVIEQHRYEQQGVKKVNVIARKGGDEPLVALSGHMDTVPFDTKKWNTDPLKLTKIGNKYFGRGVCDMKGFLAIAMKAGSEIDVSELKCPFTLVFTSDEEVGCVGAKKLIREKGKLANMVVIGEPTELEPFILHKGYMYVKVELKGKRGHSSRPNEGANVIELALPLVLSRIEEFKRHLGVIHDVRLNPPFPTLNIGVVTTGDNSAKNIIADYCCVELDIRPVPGQDVTELFHAFSTFITNGNGDINGIEVKVSYGRAPTPPMETPKDSLIVREVENMSGKIAAATSFNTEGGVFNSAGIHSVIYGPGSIQQAHKPNEFMHESYFSDDTVAKFTNLIRKLCGKK